MQIEGKQFRNAEVKVLRTNKEVSIEAGKPLQLTDGTLTDRLAPLGIGDLRIAESNSRAVTYQSRTDIPHCSSGLRKNKTLGEHIRSPSAF